jgi:hypothetical protein
MQQVASLVRQSMEGWLQIPTPVVIRVGQTLADCDLVRIEIWAEIQNEKLKEKSSTH